MAVSVVVRWDAAMEISESHQLAGIIKIVNRWQIEWTVYDFLD